MEQFYMPSLYIQSSLGTDAKQNSCISRNQPTILIQKLLFCFPFLLHGSTSCCADPFFPPTHLDSMGGTASSPVPPREGLATVTGKGSSTTSLNTTSDPCFFCCIHCCHGHVFTVVLVGVGFTLLILQTERKCHDFNLWSLASTTPTFVL